MIGAEMHILKIAVHYLDIHGILRAMSATRSLRIDLGTLAAMSFCLVSHRSSLDSLYRRFMTAEPFY
jgi:hypothetical protein